MIPLIILLIEDDSDRAFMEQFYSEYKSLMYFTAGKFIGDSNIVEEIVQETIASFIKNIKNIRARERCTLPGYVVISIKRSCLNYLNHRKVELKHREQIADDTFQANLQSDQDSVESQLMKKIDIDLMKEAFLLLPDRMQDVLEYKYFMELPDEEIAELIGVKKASVRQALTRARRALYKKMKELGHE